MRCTEAVTAGAYVLGALSPAERTVYERHMATCPQCRAEVGEIAGLPGLLGRLDPVTAFSIAHPGTAPVELLDSVLARVRRERVHTARRRVWQSTGLALAAAVVAAVLAGAGVSVVQKPPAPTPVVLASMQPMQADVPVSAVLGYRQDASGTAIKMSCLYSSPNGYGRDSWNLRLVVYPRGGGSPEPVSTWQAYAGESVSVSPHWSLPPSQIARIELQRADGTPLLVYEPA